MAQLQDVEDSPAGFALDESQIVQQFGRRDKRLLTNDIAAQSQPGSYLAMVQVIRCTDAHVVQRGRRLTLKAMGVIIEALELCEEGTVRRNAVNDAH